MRQSRPVLYIAGPYRAPNAWEVEQNIRSAEELAFAVAAADLVPLVPHTMTRFWNGTLTAQYWLDATLELMRRCDGVLLTPDWDQSEGARAEAVEAEACGMPVFTRLIDAIEFFENEVVH